MIIASVPIILGLGARYHGYLGGPGRFGFGVEGLGLLHGKRALLVHVEGLEQLPAEGLVGMLGKVCEGGLGLCV